MQLDIWRRLAATGDLTANGRAAADLEVVKIAIGSELQLFTGRDGIPAAFGLLPASLGAEVEKDYVPVLICGESGMGEYDGWDTSHVMTWRAEMHMRFATGVNDVNTRKGRLAARQACGVARPTSACGPCDPTPLIAAS